MMPTSTNSTAPKKTVSPRHAMLEELIGIVTRHLNDQYLDLFTNLAGALIDATDGDTRLIQQRIRAGNMLRNGNMAFLHLVSSTLEKALRFEIAQLAPAAKAKPLQSAQALSLVPYEEMDNKVAVSGISKPFEVLYGDALQTLNVRLAFLLDRDILRLNQNPFRPDVFLVAFQQAWLEFDTDPESANLLLPLIKPGMFVDMGPMLEALNLALQRKGVLPGSVDGYKGRKADAPPPPLPNITLPASAFAAAAAAAAAQQRVQPAALAQQLRQFFAATAAAAEEIDLSIPDIPAGAVVSSGAWAQGAAQGFNGAINNEVVQRQSQVASKRPLLSYLAQLQQSMPAMAAMAASSGSASSSGAQAYAGAGQGYGSAAQGFVAQGGAMLQGAAMAQGGAMAAPGFVSTPSSVTAGVAAAAARSGEGSSANVFYLPRIKESMPQGSLSRADESTIDLLSAIFDTVFQDQSISQEIRDLIRFLQIPVLKAALVDKDFFFQEAHPARRLIDLLSRMGWEQRKGPEDPLFQAMQRSVDRVGRDYDHELSVFTEAVNELEASIKAEEAAAAAAIAEPIAAALKQEKLAEATRSARDAVALRIGTGEVVAVVEAFLENKWTSVLTIAYSINDEKPGAVNSATRTMDELIWSVKPKLVADDRKRLIAKLPALLSSLNKWLDIIKWQDADRLQFFAELAECHASIVRAPLELAPERQVELAMQAAQQAAERRLELQAKAEADAKAKAEAQPAAPAPQVGDDHAVIEVDSLTRGMWVEFAQADGSRRKVKLAWISPLRTLYIFSTAARQEAFSMSGEALAAQFRDGSAQLVRNEGVVGIALSQAMSQAAVNDPAIAAPRTAYA